MDGDKTSRFFQVLVWVMLLYGVMGWQCVLVWFDSPGLAILIFVGLAIWSIVEYCRTKIDPRGGAERGRRREPAYTNDEIRDDYWSRLAFLRHLFIIVARLAKADGRVDETEVRVAMRLFEMYHIPSEDRAILKQVFNDAVSAPDGSTVLHHAQCISKYVHEDAAKRFVYEFLWDVACADGVLAKAEKVILKDICLWLQIDQGCFEVEYARRHRTFVDEDETREERKNQSERNNEKKTNAHSASSVDDDYLLIGVSKDASDDEVKLAYRKMAKSYHPDVLRANNVPEDLIAIANEKMVRLNAAWARIQKARGM